MIEIPEQLKMMFIVFGVQMLVLIVMVFVPQIALAMFVLWWLLAAYFWYLFLELMRR